MDTMTVSSGLQAGAVHAVQASASASGQTLGQAAGRVGQEFALQIPNAHLWSPDDPFLYDLEVTLTSSGGDQQVGSCYHEQWFHKNGTDSAAGKESRMVASTYMPRQALQALCDMCMCCHSHTHGQYYSQ